MFWSIVIAIATFAIQLILTPKPQNAKPASVDDVNAPTAEEGREIPVAFGTNWHKGPNVVWWGDFFARPNKGPRRYGFAGPRSTTSYDYLLGVHMVLCHSVPDALYQVRIGDKKFWTGYNTARVTTYTFGEQLFGDMDGVSGYWDWEPGEADQTQNDYLITQQGANVPAYRGVAGVVLRQMYLGKSPYIRPWSFKIQRVYKTSDGSAQWYEAKAGIPTNDGGKVSIQFVFDVSSAMLATNSSGQTYWDVTQEAMAGVFDRLRAAVNGGMSLDISLVIFSSSAIGASGTDVTASGIDSLESYFNTIGPTASSGSVWTAAADQIHTWWTASLGDSTIEKRTTLFFTGSVPNFITGTPDAETAAETIADELSPTGGSFNTDDGTSVAMWAFNVELADTSSASFFSNQSGDVQVLSAEDTGDIVGAVNSALVDVFPLYDMNPAHIIRECLTDPVWGMGYTSADIDDTSFTAAADTLSTEGFGLSLLWNREESIQDFIQMVQAHIDAYVYVDRTTGKFKIKLIRNDYDENTIPSFDDDDVIKWDEVQRRQPNEATTSVTVKYTHRAKRKEAARQVHNIAQIQQTGRVINATRAYPGIQKSSLAARVALRDLRSLGAGLASGRITCKRTVEGLNPGDPFWLSSARYDLNAVMRVVDIRFGDGRDNKIVITFAQDVFNVEDDLVIDTDDDEAEEPYAEPVAVTPRLVWEMPYSELVDQIGPADASSMLTTDADAGLVQAAGGRPINGALNAIFSVNSGSGYVDIDTLDFAPSAALASDITALQTSVTLTSSNNLTLDEWTVGDLAVIGDEIVRIDALSGTTMTIGRGCLDTVPAAHSAGDYVLAYSRSNMSDFVAYTDGDSVSVKLRTVTGSGDLSSGATPTDTVTFDSRAIRPLRPADVKVNGDAGFSGIVDATVYSPASAIDMTWITRKRTTETGSSVNAWTEGADAAESGQTTVIELRKATDDTLLATYSGVTSPYTIPSGDYAGQNLVKVLAYAERDGYRSQTAHSITVKVDTVEDGIDLETSDSLLIETSGDRLLVE